MAAARRRRAGGPPRRVSASGGVHLDAGEARVERRSPRRRARPGRWRPTKTTRPATLAGAHAPGQHVGGRDVRIGPARAAKAKEGLPAASSGQRSRSPRRSARLPRRRRFEDECARPASVDRGQRQRRVDAAVEFDEHRHAPQHAVGVGRGVDGARGLGRPASAGTLHTAPVPGRAGVAPAPSRVVTARLERMEHARRRRRSGGQRVERDRESGGDRRSGDRRGQRSVGGSRAPASRRATPIGFGEEDVEGDRRGAGCSASASPAGPRRHAATAIARAPPGSPRRRSRSPRGGRPAAGPSGGRTRRGCADRGRPASPAALRRSSRRGTGRCPGARGRAGRASDARSSGR